MVVRDSGPIIADFVSFIDIVAKLDCAFESSVIQTLCDDSRQL